MSSFYHSIYLHASCQVTVKHGGYLQKDSQRCFLSLQEVISLSEGSTVDLRRPGEEEEDYSEMGDDAMDPDECFPECE